MKADLSDFGFEILITYLLPGVVAVLAGVFFFGVTVEDVKAVIKEAEKMEFLVSFVLLAIVSALGAVIASVHGVIEGCFLDKISAMRLRLSNKEFEEHWDAYVEKLPTISNSYIARVVLFFQFETRMGLALVVLSLSLFHISCIYAICALCAALVLYAIGAMHHKHLAEMREKLFSAKPRE